MPQGQGLQIPRNATPELTQAMMLIERHVAEQLRAPPYFPPYAKADMPDPAQWANCAIIVPDEAGGRTIATSDGAHWRRVSNGAIVS